MISIAMEKNHDLYFGMNYSALVVREEFYTVLIVFNINAKHSHTHIDEAVLFDVSHM